MQYGIASILRMLLLTSCFINSQALVFPFPVPFPDTVDIVDERPVVFHFTAVHAERAFSVKDLSLIHIYEGVAEDFRTVQVLQLLDAVIAVSYTHLV